MRLQERHAGMAELADALDSGSSEDFLHAGSSPVSRTKAKEFPLNGSSFFVNQGVVGSSPT